jgi:hypothetical protein
MKSTFEGFWRWRLLIREIFLFDSVQHLNYKTAWSQRWILLSSSRKEWIIGQKTYLLGPLQYSVSDSLLSYKFIMKTLNKVQKNNITNKMKWLDFLKEYLKTLTLICPVSMNSKTENFVRILRKDERGSFNHCKRDSSRPNHWWW